MTMPDDRRMPADMADAVRWLSGQDPVIAKLADQYGLPEFPAPTGTKFANLVQSITYQQLATPAARAIHGRLITALGEQVTAERILGLSVETLRGVGLSMRKVESLRELAAKSLDGTVPLDGPDLAELPDDEIVARLSSVKGIGPWSAEMFLMWQLLRPDIWPTGDLAVRRGYANAWQVPVPTPRQLLAAGEPFHPYRSLVAWYCWHAQ